MAPARNGSQSPNECLDSTPLGLMSKYQGITNLVRSTNIMQDIIANSNTFPKKCHPDYLDFQNSPSL